MTDRSQGRPNGLKRSGAVLICVIGADPEDLNFLARAKIPAASATDDRLLSPLLSQFPRREGQLDLCPYYSGTPVGAESSA